MWREMSYHQRCFAFKTTCERLRDEYEEDKIDYDENKEFVNGTIDTDIPLQCRYCDFLL